MGSGAGPCARTERQGLVRKMTALLLGMVLLLAAAVGVSAQAASAGLEWNTIKDLEVKAAPLDVASSADGKWLFVLTPGEVLVYALREEAIAARIPVGREFDRIVSLPRPDRLAVASSGKKTLRLIRLDEVHKFDLQGRAFRGPADAPVVVAVFVDYQ